MGLIIPLPNGRTLWLINRGDPNHLLNGMILQVTSLKLTANFVKNGWLEDHRFLLGFCQFSVANFAVDIRDTTVCNYWRQLVVL